MSVLTKNNQKQTVMGKYKILVVSGIICLLASILFESSESHRWFDDIAAVIIVISSITLIVEIIKILKEWVCRKP